MPLDLDAELLHAMQLAHHDIVTPLFAGSGLTRRVQWGVARVDYFGLDRRYYEPQRDGPAMAFIVPVVEGGDLIDLAAVDGTSQHVGTRLGNGRGLGLDAVAKARMGCADLHLVERPLDWLRHPVDRFYLFRLSDVAVTLYGVAQVTCRTVDFAERVQAMLPSSRHAAVVLDP